MRNGTWKHIICALVLLCLTACNLPTTEEITEQLTPVDLNAVQTEVVAEFSPTETETTLPLPTATMKPAEVLTVCLGKEPQTLFFYHESSQTMWSVLESIYDGPFDHINGEDVPVIFESVKTTFESVPVKLDTVYYDENQQVKAIKNGSVIYPSNPLDICKTDECKVTWGMTAVPEDVNVEMRQTVITFTLKEGLFWSDGEPLTAEDSIFSKKVNGMKGIKASTAQLNVTESYEAKDTRTVVWRGIPGYIPSNVSEVFWIPLPSHLMNGMSAEQIEADQIVNRAPIGWGPYRVSEWSEGEQIVMERNPYYRRTDGSEPFFDKVVYKFYGRAGDNNIQALESGTCDIIDSSVDLGSDLEPVLEDVRDGKYAVYIQPELTWQQITFGVDSLKKDSAKLFTLKETRQAVAQCINRKALNRQVFYGQSEIPNDFYPEAYREHDTAAASLPYDPEAAKALLDEIGWKDSDEDPSTPRVSANVRGLYNGVELSFELSISESPQAMKAAEMIKEDLEECGIGLTINALPLANLYGQGPEGILYGRQFDAALFSWSSGSSSPCGLYLSDRIPNQENNWIGVNVGGFSSADYDTSCRAVLAGTPNADLSALYTDEVPSLPLYFNLSIAASSLRTCGVADAIGSRSVLWNIENLSRSDSACAVSQWHDIYQ